MEKIFHSTFDDATSAQCWGPRAPGDPPMESLDDENF